MDIYLRRGKPLTVHARIIHENGNPTFGFLAAAATHKRWAIDTNQNGYIEPDEEYGEFVDFWLTPEDVAWRVFDFALLCAGFVAEGLEGFGFLTDLGLLQAAFDALSWLDTAGGVAEYIALLGADEYSNESPVDFAFDGQPGLNRFSVGVRSEAYTVFLTVGHGTGIIGGVVEEIAITGICPPEKAEIDGLSEGFMGFPYGFEAVATDINGDDIQYRFWWGDGTSSDWSEFVPSGEPVLMYHTFETPGIYEITVEARDGDWIDRGVKVWMDSLSDPFDFRVWPAGGDAARSSAPLDSRD
jgi:hypothetical protein